MAPSLPRRRAPIGQDESTHIGINYSYILGYTWIECGVSRVNNFLSALGFNSSQQLAAMCATTNIFSLFAADDWIKAFVNAEDRKLIYGAPLKIAGNFLPNFASAINPVFNAGSQNPTYSDFFQLIFSYLTHGQNAAERQQFIKWWSSENGINTDPKFAYVGNITPRNPQKTLQDSALVLITFKNAVDEFLKQPAGNGENTAANSFLPAGFAPPSGMIPYAVGQASVVRIPIWAGAWAGCKVVGAGGAAVGTFVEPGLGTAIGGVGGCIIGGAGGYFVGSTIAGEVYDWAEGTFFTPLPETQKP